MERRIVGGMALFIALALLALHGTAVTEELYLVRPHGITEVFDSEKAAQYYPKSGAAVKQLSTNGLTFNITYEDVGVGFNDPVSGPAVRARFEAVLEYVASVINVSNRTLDVLVEASQFDGSGALATAGTFYPGSPGFHTGSTLARLQTGTKPFPGFPEIQVQVDKGFQWNIGAAAPGPGEADFFSVLLHEMTHGLGFASLVLPDGTSSVGGPGQGIFTSYDSLLFDGVSGQRVLSAASNPTIQVDPSSLTNEDIWFDGASSFALYAQGTRAPVFAPSPFQQGSSISHWDINTLVGGGVMTHAIILGSARRQFAFVDIGALMDIGYTNIDPEEAVLNMLADELAGAFGVADANSDGTLTLAEAQAESASASAVRFNTLDTNNDGVLTEAELAEQVPGNNVGAVGGEGNGCAPAKVGEGGLSSASGDILLLAVLASMLAGSRSQHVRRKRI